MILINEFALNFKKNLNAEDYINYVNLYKINVKGGEYDSAVPPNILSGNDGIQFFFFRVKGTDGKYYEQVSLHSPMYSLTDGWNSDYSDFDFGKGADISSDNTTKFFGAELKWTDDNVPLVVVLKETIKSTFPVGDVG